MGAYVDAVLASDPVHYWKLNEPSGTTADDFVGTLNGTHTDQVSTNYLEPGVIMGELETSIELIRSGGGGASVSIPTDASLEIQSFSVEFWTWRTIFSNSLGRSIAWSLDNADTGSTPTRGVQVYYDTSSNAWTAVLYDSSGATKTATKSLTQEDYLHRHIVITHDATADLLTIHTDGAAGTPTSTTGFTIAYPTTNARVWIGRQGTGAYDAANTGGIARTVAHVAFYDRALSAAEILEHYEKGNYLDDSFHAGVDDYATQTWVNAPSQTTPISASRLGHIESGIRDAFEGRRQEATYVLVASDAPDYMKRGAKVIVCDGTDDQDDLSLALADLTRRNRPATTVSRGTILLSPGRFVFNVNPDFTDGAVQRCAWDQHDSNASMTGLTIMGCGSSTVLSLAAGQTGNVRMIDIGNNNFHARVEDLTFEALDAVEDPGERIGLYIKASFWGVHNLRGTLLSGPVVDSLFAYECLIDGIHVDGSKYGVRLNEAYSTVVRVYGESYVTNSVGVLVLGDSQLNTIEASMEGCLRAAVELRSVGADIPRNNDVRVHAFYGEGQGVRLEGATENRITGRVAENFSSHGVALYAGSDHNDLDLHVIGNDYHGILLDGSSHNRIRGVVTANGQANGATPVYDNIHLEDNSDSNDIEIFSRKSTTGYATESRHGIHIGTSDCNNNRIGGDLLNSGSAQSVWDAGTGTITQSTARTA